MSTRALRGVARGATLLTLIGLAALAVVQRDPGRRNLEVLPADMVRGPAAESGRPSELLRDGRVQQTPPEGAIARGHLPLPYGPGPEEAARAGRELVNPVAADAAVLARGAAVFAAACACCHGAGGRADAPATQRGVPPPPTLIRPESRALSDGEIFHAITFGRKNMPAAALQVEREDRWKVIRYLRSLQETP